MLYFQYWVQQFIQQIFTINNHTITQIFIYYQRQLSVRTNIHQGTLIIKAHIS